ncbi:hypothetical protein RCH13_000235 [Chryseobacterium sp. MP_3.2]|nr:hypothetical protein [Chryseobacterium sp. MP_3.2]
MRKKRFYKNCILLNEFLNSVADETLGKFVERVANSLKRFEVIQVIENLNSEI